MKLEELKALCDKATPGDWPQDFSRIDDSEGGCAATGPIIRCDDQDIEESQAQADQDFIIAARTMLPRLIAVAEILADIRDLRFDAPNIATEFQNARVMARNALSILEAP